MQGMKLHAHNWPIKSEKRKYTIRKSGKSGKSGLIQLIRNTAFEPSFFKDKKKELEKCLSEITMAFILK